MNKAKAHMSITIIGHVSSGKTTVAERLNYMSGGIDRQTIHNIEKEATDISRTSFKNDLVLERQGSTLRDRGISIEDSLNKCETVNYYITIIAAPSYRDFVKSGITRPTQVDCAVLIVSACVGEFESGISRDGQTREHILLAYTMGVRQLIVAVNKMDAEDVSYSGDRFNKIKTELSSYIMKVGYKSECVAFVPISARHDENLIEVSEKMPWFKGWTLKRKEGIVTGKTLLEALDATSVPQRPINKPLRLPLQDVYKICGIGTVAVGRVETGVLKPNMVVQFAPSNLTATVQSIEMHHTAVEKAVPGDNIGFNVSIISVRELRRGFVCSDAQNEPAQQTASFIAQVTVLNHPNQIMQGYTSVLGCHMARVPCRFVELLEKIDRRTGKIIEASPKFIKSGDTAIVKIVPMKPICVETFDDYPSLGRFIIRDMKQTMAVGIIKEVEKMSITSEDTATSTTIRDSSKN